MLILYSNVSMNLLYYAGVMPATKNYESIVCSGFNNTYKRRVLYDKSSRSLPANFVDNSFLKGLQKNVNLKTYHLWDAIVNTTVTTQELNSVCGLFSSFVLLDNQSMAEGTLFLSSSFVVVCFYIVFEANWSLNNIYKDIKRALVYLAFILGLSPVLKTLTHTVSTDSIYFMAVTLMIIHLVTYDYGLDICTASFSLSLTAAIAASVTLASRLSTIFYVFEFLTLAVELIALFPILRRKIEKKWKRSRVPLTILIVIAGQVAAWIVSPIFAILLFILELFINIFCPIMFIRWQKYKDNIFGPWDEATINRSCASQKIRF